MKYSTRQIVNRALALTDFNDDFFIGNREMTNLLNDCFQECYELLISRSDRTFIKTITLSDGEKLPYDFFKVLEIKDDQHNFLTKNQDYDIENNRIKLFNSQRVKFVYYPQPHALTLKANDSSSMSFDNVITKWEDGFVTSSELIDTNGNTVVSLTGSISTYLFNGCIRNGVLTSYQGSEISTVKFISGNEITYDDVVIDSDIENVVALIAPKSRAFFFLLTSDKKLYSQKGELIRENFQPLTFFCKDDGLYFVENGMLKKALGTVIEEFPSVYNVSGILDEDYAIFSAGTTQKKCGYGVDTFLDIPSSTFWSYFAYSIAISICNVVQRDSAALQQKADEIKANFLNSLDWDNNASYQVRDVETYRQW